MTDENIRGSLSGESDAGRDARDSAAAEAPGMSTEAVPGADAIRSEQELCRAEGVVIRQPRELGLERGPEAGSGISAPAAQPAGQESRDHGELRAVAPMRDSGHSIRAEAERRTRSRRVSDCAADDLAALHSEILDTLAREHADQVRALNLQIAELEHELAQSRGRRSGMVEIVIGELRRTIHGRS